MVAGIQTKGARSWWYPNEGVYWEEMDSGIARKTQPYRPKHTCVRESQHTCTPTSSVIHLYTCTYIPVAQMIFCLVSIMDIDQLTYSICAHAMHLLPSPLPHLPTCVLAGPLAMTGAGVVWGVMELWARREGRSVGGAEWCLLSSSPPSFPPSSLYTTPLSFLLNICLSAVLL